MTKKLIILCLWPFSWTITHSFGVPGWFPRSMTLSTCLSGMTKNCHFCVLGPFHELLPTVLVFCGDLQGPWHLVHVWVTWPKTHHFCVYGHFSWPIAHSFGVPGWFTRPMTLSTCWSGMTKNSSFLHFRAVFMSYCLQFCGFGVIYKDQDT
jgi:hypothetical protein